MFGIIAAAFDCLLVAWDFRISHIHGLIPHGARPWRHFPSLASLERAKRDRIKDGYGTAGCATQDTIGRE